MPQLNSPNSRPCQSLQAIDPSGAGLHRHPCSFVSLGLLTVHKLKSKHTLLFL